MTQLCHRLFRKTAIERLYAVEEFDQLIQILRFSTWIKKSVFSDWYVEKFRRVKTATLLQMEAVECGAVALSIVLNFYGLHIPVETLRIQCGVSRDGIKASHLIRVARYYGMMAKGYRREPEKLSEMRLPLIIFWQFKHFLVVEGFGNNRIYINDPATGRRTLTTREFDDGFTGVVLELKPDSTFSPNGQKPSMMSALRHRLQDEWLSVLFLIMTGLALTATGLLIPIFSQLFIDQYWLGHKTLLLEPLLLGMTATAFLRTLLSWLQIQLVTQFHSKLTLSSSQRFMRHLLRLPMLFYSQRSAGEMSQRVRLNNQLAQFLANNVAESILAIIMVVSYAAVMLFFDTTLTAVTIAIGLLNGLILCVVSQKRKTLNQRLLQEQGKLIGLSMNGLRSIESLKAAGNESDFFTKWAGTHANALNTQQYLIAATLLLNSMPLFLTTLNNITILVLGSLSIMEGSLTIGGLIAFQSLAMSFLSQINQLFEMGTKLQDITGNVQRLDDVINQPIDPVIAADEDKLKQTKITSLSGQLSLKNIRFGFCPLEPPLLENIDLTVHTGKRIALVGASGSGKSTLVKLICGLYQPWSGEILFDGLQRKEISRSIFNRSFAFVDQDVTVFEGSIRDNLLLWHDDISEEQMIQAAKDAHIHDVILNRVKGYDEIIEESGRNFSGGELQRLEIARALALNPTILILDEATRMLDSHSEQIIYENLRRRGCTCLILTHRLSTLRACDEIIVLESGKIVQQGTHDNLKKIEGVYHSLITAQMTDNTQCYFSMSDLPSKPTISSIQLFDTTSPLHELQLACQVLGKYTEIDFVFSSNNDTTRLADIAQSTGVRYRQVKLTNEWWQKECGCLLAFNNEGKPLVLIYTGRSYTLHNPVNNQKQRVTAKVAKTLQPNAFTFYRPLPNTPINLYALRYRQYQCHEMMHVTFLIKVSTSSCATFLLPNWALTTSSSSNRSSR